MNHKSILKKSLICLAKQFNTLDLSFHKMNTDNTSDITSYWPGKADEDIMVCVFKGKKINEPFHRQDFFFINYAYQNSYNALSYSSNNLITIKENELYLGQPYSGYALRGDSSDDDIIIIGVLIKRDFFFREYLPSIYTDSHLFHFFLTPSQNKFSEEYIHIPDKASKSIRTMLEMMVIEYAYPATNTQLFLKTMFQTLILEIARQYHTITYVGEPKLLSDKIISYINNHISAVTLKEIANHFAYHPNYISSILKKETGRNFNEILLEKRMDRAVLLMKNTPLSIEKIAAMLGYSNHSNFYKVFKNYYGKTPRDYFIHSLEN